LLNRTELRDVEGDGFDVQLIRIDAVANLMNVPDADILGTLLFPAGSHEFLDTRMHVVVGMDRNSRPP